MEIGDVYPAVCSFYTLIVNAIAIVVALVLAKEKKVSGVGRAFYYIPYIIGLTAISLIWKFIFGSRGKMSKLCFGLLIMPMMVPFQFYMITLTQMVTNVKLSGTRLGYIVVSIGLCMPLAVYMIHGFVKNIPLELEECACMDGATKIRTYFNTVFPLLKPILTTVIVFDALAIWNDIITNQLIVGGKERAMNIQNALYMRFSAQVSDWEHALPGIIMSIIPCLIFF